MVGAECGDWLTKHGVGFAENIESLRQKTSTFEVCSKLIQLLNNKSFRKCIFYCVLLSTDIPLMSLQSSITEKNIIQ